MEDRRGPGRPKELSFPPEDQLTEWQRRLSEMVENRRRRQRDNASRRRNNQQSTQVNLAHENEETGLNAHQFGTTVECNSPMDITELIHTLPWDDHVEVYTNSLLPVLQWDDKEIAESEVYTNSLLPVLSLDDEEIADIEVYTNRVLQSNEFSPLQRGASLRSIAFNDFAARLISLPQSAYDALVSMSIFPDSFDVFVAHAVSGFPGLIDPDDIMNSFQPLFEARMITEDATPLSLPNRFRLNDVARSFVLDMLESNTQLAIVSEKAKVRMVVHYTEWLNRISELSIHSKGSDRAEAMKEYDGDRQNMEFTYAVACELGDQNLLRSFLVASVPSMRFCVGAQTRVNYLTTALERIQSYSSQSRFSAEYLRLELALAEAYMDVLDVENAREPVSRVFSVLGANNGTNLINRVICKLLSAIISIQEGNVERAHELLVSALNLLSCQQLSHSTYAISAMSYLVTIYLLTSQYEKAEKQANDLLNLLYEKGYSSLPIFADVLGVMGTVSLVRGDAGEAERQFKRGLEIVAEFESEKWSETPLHHCLDLRLWLMKGLANTFAAQGRHIESQTLVRICQENGLIFSPRICWEVDLQNEFSRWFTAVRHIY